MHIPIRIISILFCSSLMFLGACSEDIHGITV